MGREGARLAEFLRIAGSASEQEVLAVEQCQLAHIVAAVGQEGDLLVHLHALGAQHHKQTRLTGCFRCRRDSAWLPPVAMAPGKFLRLWGAR
jgi:hypothetical protein